MANQTIKFKRSTTTDPTSLAFGEPALRDDGGAVKMFVGNNTPAVKELPDINGYTADPTPDLASDYALVYDASAGVNKKVLLNLIGSGGGGGSFVVAEVPSGAVNGSNVTFTLANTPSSDVLLVVNGVSLKSGSGNDFTLSGSTLTLAVAPASGSNIYASYGSTSTSTYQIGKNAIINGDFNVWQRGTPFTSIASGSYSADRFQYGKSGAMVHDISRSTDVPTVAEAGRLFSYSLLLDCTTADTSIAASDYTSFQQVIEGYNWLPLAQKAITLSFWVKATKTGIYCVSFRNSGFDRSYVAEYTISASDTWEFKTITVPASPSGGTWNYTNGVGLRIYFALAMGTTYHTTAGSWQTGDFLATANQVNGVDSVSNNFRITGMQLEVGSSATSFEYRTIQQEEFLCKRYFEEMATGANAESFGVGVEQSSTSGNAMVRYEVTKRSTPTISFSAASTFRALDNGSHTLTGISAGDVSTKSFAAVMTTTGLTTGYAVQLTHSGSGTASIQVNSEF